MNKVILMGRLTRDPDVRYTQGDNSLCIARFSIAVDRRFGRNNPDGPTADFIDCVAFGKTAEHVEKYYRKGTKTCLTGRIQNDNYTNREGVKIYRNVIVAEELEFAESKSASNANSGNYGGGNFGGNAAGGNASYNGGNNYGGNSYNAGNNGGNAGSAPDALDGFMNIPDGIDEELPFS